jgi:hypothetical protein
VAPIRLDRENSFEDAIGQQAVDLENPGARSGGLA